MEAPRLFCAFLESWDAPQGGIQVRTEDKLSMPAEKPGYASDMSSADKHFLVQHVRKRGLVVVYRRRNSVFFLEFLELHHQV